MKKNDSINGNLSIKDKIWFNDAVRCRLRIGGFSKDDIKKLEESNYIDMSLVENDGDDKKLYPYKVAISIHDRC